MKKVGLIVALIVIAGAGAMVLLQPEGQREAAAAETTVVVSSLKCESCQQTVEGAVGQLPGVETVAVDLGAKTATVSYQAGQVTVAQIEDAIVSAGYSANDREPNPDAYAALPACCKAD